METRGVSISKIQTGDHIQRFKLSEEKLADLKQSISDLGLISPIGVRVEGDGYRLIYGHCRLEVCRRLGWSEIPAVLLWHEAADEESVTFAENFFRTDLTAVELAAAIVKELDKGRLTAEQIAAGFHRSPDWVRHMVSMMGWPTEVLEAVHSDGLSASAGANLALIEEEEYRNFLVRQAVESGATARTTAAWLSAWRLAMPAKEAVLLPPAPVGSLAAPAVPQAPCFCCAKVYRTDGLSHVPICCECIQKVRKLSSS